MPKEQACNITLYTNHGCPFAQRAHIALEELNLHYDEVIIDLESPRPQWYLDINPRGLVPTIRYSRSGDHDAAHSTETPAGEEIISESAIVAQFLCDTFPSHLLPASDSHGAPLARARIMFFCQTWSEKISPSQFAIMRAVTAEEKEIKLQETLSLIEKELEPLLADAAPFFGGSRDLTFAEVFTAPFVMRWIALAEDGKMVPRTLLDELKRLPNFEKWTHAILQHEKATRIFEKDKFVEFSRRRMQKMKGA